MWGVLYQPLCPLHPALPPPEVSIASPALFMMAGGPLTVPCTATVLPFLVTTPTLQWRRFDGSIVSTSPPSAGGMEVPAEVVLELEFSPLRTSHGDQYSCVANITIPGIATAEASNSTGIIVQSESVFPQCSPEC